MSGSILLTVFTPTYNRRTLLPRVYESLLAQSCHDLIWLIVDDGSGDGTGDYIRSISADAPFRIEYRYQENGGKMRAHNRGSELCETELFLCLDSDDVLTPGTVQTVIDTWNAHRSCHKCMKASSERAGIIAYKGTPGPDGSPEPFLGYRFDADSLRLGFSTLRGLYLKGFRGETSLVLRTDLLKKYPFPEIPGEKYVPEDYIYDKIDSECPFLVVGEIMTVCELMEGGYTHQAEKLRRENPHGWLLYYEQRSRIQKMSLLKLKYLSHYLRFCQVTGQRPDLSLPMLLIAAPGALILKLLGKT